MPDENTDNEVPREVLRDIPASDRPPPIPEPTFPGKDLSEKFKGLRTSGAILTGDPLLTAETVQSHEILIGFGPSPSVDPRNTEDMIAFLGSVSKFEVDRDGYLVIEREILKTGERLHDALVNVFDVTILFFHGDRVIEKITHRVCSMYRSGIACDYRNNVYVERVWLKNARGATREHYNEDGSVAFSQ